MNQKEKQEDNMSEQVIRNGLRTLETLAQTRISLIGLNAEDISLLQKIIFTFIRSTLSRKSTPSVNMIDKCLVCYFDTEKLSNPEWESAKKFLNRSGREIIDEYRNNKVFEIPI